MINELEIEKISLKKENKALKEKLEVTYKEMQDHNRSERE